MSLSPFVNGRFPATRLRRMRRDDFSRRLMRETTLTPSDLILPVFVQEGAEMRQPVAVDARAVGAAQRRRAGAGGAEGAAARHPAIAIFPVTPASRRARTRAKPGTLTVSRSGRQGGQRSRSGARRDHRVALDPFTTHGQDGLIDATGYVLNDETWRPS